MAEWYDERILDDIASLRSSLEAYLSDGWAKNLAITKVDECKLWVGEAIAHRDA